MHCPATPTHLLFTSAFSDFWLSGPTRAVNIPEYPSCGYASRHNYTYTMKFLKVGGAADVTGSVFHEVSSEILAREVCT